MRATLLRTATTALAAAAAIAACGSSARTSTHDPAAATTRDAARPTTATTTALTHPTTTALTHPTTTHSARPTPRQHSSGVVAVRVSPTSYGPALVDRRGFALYLFTHDRSPSSTCYDACAAAWPPYVVGRRPSAVARGARGQRVGTVRRRDGTLQVTYAGHPLYHYVGDRRPGQILCQAVAEYGGTWYVVAPSGTAIR